MDSCSKCDIKSTYKVYVCRKCNNVEVGYSYHLYCPSCARSVNAIVLMTLEYRCREHIPPDLFCTGCDTLHDQREKTKKCILCSEYNCQKHSVLLMDRKYFKNGPEWACKKCVYEMIAERLECQGLVKSANKVTD